MPIDLILCGKGQRVVSPSGYVPLNKQYIQNYPHGSISPMTSADFFSLYAFVIFLMQKRTAVGATVLLFVILIAVLAYGFCELVGNCADTAENSYLCCGAA